MTQYFENDPLLESKIRLLKYSFTDFSFIFKSDLGVFAKNKIDIGSKVLAETYFYFGRKNIDVLDVGCGYGFIGITIAKIMNCNVEMIDINNRALSLAKMNIISNGVKANIFFSNIYQEINKLYDVIITNPPIRAGKMVYLKIINDSFKYLKENGELWFVMKNNYGVKSIIKNLQKNHIVKILKKNKGFYVIIAKNKLTS